MLDKNGEKADAESKTIHILTEDLGSLVTTCYPAREGHSKADKKYLYLFSFFNYRT